MAITVCPSPLAKPLHCGTLCFCDNLKMLQKTQRAATIFLVKINYRSHYHPSLVSRRTMKENDEKKQRLTVYRNIDEKIGSIRNAGPI